MAGAWAVSGRKLAVYAALSFLVVATVLLFSGRQGHAFIPRSLQELWNFGHVLYFLVVIVLARRTGLLSGLRALSQWSLYLLLVLSFGLLIEVIQSTPRIPVDWFDVLRDLVGGALGLALTARPRSMVQRRWRRAVRWLLGVCVMLLLTPAALAVIDELHARVQFPVLADFSSPLERGRWSSPFPLRIEALDEQPGEAVLRVDLQPALYAGLSLDYPERDWRSYRWLRLRVFQPRDEPLSMTLRIHDQAHESGRLAYAYSDRFNRSFVLEPGWNEIRVALADVRQAPFLRDMDMARIANLSLFAVRLGRPWTIYVDRLALSDQ